MALTSTRQTATRHVHRNPLLLGTVFVGGACGTGIRSLLEDAFSRPTDSWPWITFAINVIGAFVLALLLEALVLSGEDTGGRRLLRLGLGTGVLGGFTTYSTFMVETTKLPWPVAVAYVVTSVVVGAFAARVGIRAARLAPRRGGENG